MFGPSERDIRNTDVDLAIWVEDPGQLRSLRRVAALALNRLLAEKEIGVAHHQVDIFVLEPGTNRYLGRLCPFGSCPKGKPELGAGLDELIRRRGPSRKEKWDLQKRGRPRPDAQT